MEPINLLNVVRYFEGKPHQIKAIEYLQKAVSPDILKQFVFIWRQEAEKTIEDRIMSRLNDLNIVLDEGVNLIGLEGCNLDFTYSLKDEYNDLVLIVESRNGSINILDKAVCTTEPGVYYTKTRLNPAGAARLEIDFKQNRVWEVGKHKNQFPALVQTGGKVRVRRDGNEDFSRANDKIEEGFFGINFHHGDGSGKIGKWSAGCVVVDEPKEHKILMELIIKTAKKYNQTKFSFILLDFSKVK